MPHVSLENDAANHFGRDEEVEMAVLSLLHPLDDQAFFRTAEFAHEFELGPS